jgi:hypothetical protein
MGMEREVLGDTAEVTAWEGIDPVIDPLVADIRGRFIEVREQVRTGRCPRDKARIAATISALNIAKNIVDDQVTNADDGVPERWFSVIPSCTVLALGMLFSAAKEPIGSRLVPSLVAFVSCVVAVAAYVQFQRSKAKSRQQKRDNDIADEYDATIALLAEQVDETREYEQRPDKTYVGVLGSESDLESLRRLRSEIRGVRHSFGPEIFYAESANAAHELGGFSGRRMNARFETLLAEVCVELDALRAQAKDWPKDVRICQESGATATAEPEEAPHAADPKREGEA